MSGHWLPGFGRARLVRSQGARALLTGFSAGLLVFVCGAPYWCEHVVNAVVAGLACAGFGAAGALLATGEPGRRFTGRLLLAGAFCWPIAWLISWDSGILPMISFYGQGSFFVLVGAAILSYPTGRLARRRERTFVVAAAALLIGGELVMQLIARPEWIGLSADVVWPTLATTRTAFDVGVKTMAVGQVVLAFWFVVLLWVRARWLSALDRRVAIPVLVAAAALVIISSIQAVVQDQAWTNLAALESFYFTQGVIALTVCAGLVSGALRDRWWELNAPHRVVRHTSSGTSVTTVRSALAEALRDDSLLLLFWAPAERAWIDPAGHPVRLGTTTENINRPDRTERWRIPLLTDDLSPLAIVEVEASLRLRPTLVDAVLRAGRQALLTAQLQAAASAHLTLVIAAQQRLEEKERAERRRLEQDLHAGARQKLGDLARRLDQLSGPVPRSSSEHRDVPGGSGAASGFGVFRVFRAEVLATIDELDALASGLLPPELRAEGLAPALRTVVARLELDARLDVCPGRFPAAVEATLYFAVCEALTNVAKYARDAAVLATVVFADGWLHATVADDGPGGAQRKPDGGLAGIEDRSRALGGWITLESRPGQGTSVRVSLPTADRLVPVP